MKRSHVALIIATPVVVVACFVAARSFLGPPERKTPMAFSDLLTAVHEGRVDEIHVRGHSYVARVRNADPAKGSDVKEAIGPAADSALLASLKPEATALPPPKITIEKDD